MHVTKSELDTTFEAIQVISWATRSKVPTEAVPTVCTYNVTTVSKPVPLFT